MTGLKNICFTLTFITLATSFSLKAVAQSLGNDNDEVTIGGTKPHFDESAPQRIMPTRFGGRSRHGAKRLCRTKRAILASNTTTRFTCLRSASMGSRNLHGLCP